HPEGHWEVTVVRSDCADLRGQNPPAGGRHGAGTPLGTGLSGRFVWLPTGLLGILGAMSEAELHWLRNRLLGGKLARAEQGELRMRPPVGLVYDRARQLVLDADEEVQQAVRLLFTLFEQTGSALAVVKHFGDHHLLFPDRLWGKGRDGELLWKPLRHGRV